MASSSTVCALSQLARLRKVLVTPLGCPKMYCLDALLLSSCFYSFSTPFRNEGKMSLTVTNVLRITGLHRKLVTRTNFSNQNQKYEYGLVPHCAFGV